MQINRTGNMYKFLWLCESQKIISCLINVDWFWWGEGDCMWNMQLVLRHVFLLRFSCPALVCKPQRKPVPMVQTPAEAFPAIYQHCCLVSPDPFIAAENRKHQFYFLTVVWWLRLTQPCLLPLLRNGPYEQWHPSSKITLNGRLFFLIFLLGSKEQWGLH